jgi:hypothetical protein
MVGQDDFSLASEPRIRRISEPTDDRRDAPTMLLPPFEPQLGRISVALENRRNRRDI